MEAAINHFYSPDAMLPEKVADDMLGVALFGLLCVPSLDILEV